MVVGKTNIDSDQMDAAKPTRTDTQNQNQQRPNLNPNPNPNSKNKKKKGGPISMDHVLLALQETKDERDLRIRALFDFFDAANLGYLDYPQIEAGLLALQIPSHYKYAKDLFKVCDANRDGRVDYHEFRRYMDDKELELYRIFQAIDVKHSGCILPEELWDALLKAGTFILFFYYFPLRSITTTCQYSCSSIRLGMSKICNNVHKPHQVP